MNSINLKKCNPLRNIQSTTKFPKITFSQIFIKRQKNLPTKISKKNLYTINLELK